METTYFSGVTCLTHCFYLRQTTSCTHLLGLLEHTDDSVSNLDEIYIKNVLTDSGATNVSNLESKK